MQVLRFIQNDISVKIILILIILCVNLEAQDTDIDRAVKLYETRYINIDNVYQSLNILQKVMENEPDNLRANIELAHTYYFIGDIEKDKEKKNQLYIKGMEYGKKAMKINSNSIGAHFWYLANLGRSGQLKGLPNSLVILPELQKEVDTVLKLEPNHTGALDVKAMIYFELPEYFGGNLDKSIEFLTKAIEIDSHYTRLYVDMGRVYAKKKNYDKVRWYLNKVLSIENPKYKADYILNDKPFAIKLLKLIEEKDTN